MSAGVYKIVFAGPVGAGKTRAIKTLSDIEVVAARTADAVDALKAQTPVAMDYGVMNLANGDRVRLYGTPGLERSNFLWEILSDQAFGLVLLIDGSASDPGANLRACVAALRQLIDIAPLVVGVTHTDWGDRRVRPAIAEELRHMGIVAPVMSADARERSDMALLVKALIFSLDPYDESP